MCAIRDGGMLHGQFSSSRFVSDELGWFPGALQLLRSWACSRNEDMGVFRHVGLALTEAALELSLDKLHHPNLKRNFVSGVL